MQSGGSDKHKTRLSDPETRSEENGRSYAIFFPNRTKAERRRVRSYSDIVAFHEDSCVCVGELLCNFEVDGACYSIIAAWDRTHDANPNFSWARFCVQHEPRLVRSSCVEASLIASLNMENHRANVLLPPWLR